MNKEFVTTVDIIWSAPEEATEKDAEEALVRSGLKYGELIGEWMIQDIERVEEY